MGDNNRSGRSLDQNGSAKRTTSSKSGRSPAADDTFTASDYLVGNAIDNIEGMMKLVRENKENNVIDNSSNVLSPDREGTVEERALNENKVCDLLNPRELSKTRGMAQHHIMDGVPVQSQSNIGTHQSRTKDRKAPRSKKMRGEKKEKAHRHSRQQRKASDNAPASHSNATGPIRVETSRMMTINEHGDLMIDDRIQLLGVGRHSKMRKLEKLLPTTQSLNPEGDARIRPNCSQSVSAGYKHILIERTTLLKLTVPSCDANARCTETRLFRNSRQTRGTNKVESEDSSGKKSVFDLYGPLEVISKQETTAETNKGYTLRESIELRADGSISSPVQELIPFKGEVRRPHGGEPTTCTYDERVHAGTNVVVLQRQIHVAPSVNANKELFCVTESRSYSTDKTVTLLSSTSNGFGSLPSLSSCGTASSPGTVTPPWSPSHGSIKDPTAKSPTLKTAASARSFGSISPARSFSMLSEQSSGSRGSPMTSVTVPPKTEPPQKLGVTGSLIQPRYQTSGSLMETNLVGKQDICSTPHRSVPVKPKRLFSRRMMNLIATTPPNAKRVVDAIAVTPPGARSPLYVEARIPDGAWHQVPTTPPLNVHTPRTPTFDLSPVRTPSGVELARTPPNECSSYPDVSTAWLNTNKQRLFKHPAFDVIQTAPPRINNGERQLKPLHARRIVDLHTGTCRMALRDASAELPITQPSSEPISVEDASMNLEQLSERSEFMQRKQIEKGISTGREKSPKTRESLLSSGAVNVIPTVLKNTEQRLDTARPNSFEKIQTGKSNSRETMHRVEETPVRLAESLNATRQSEPVNARHSEVALLEVMRNNASDVKNEQMTTVKSLKPCWKTARQRTRKREKSLRTAKRSSSNLNRWSTIGSLTKSTRAEKSNMSTGEPQLDGIRSSSSRLNSAGAKEMEPRVWQANEPVPGIDDSSDSRKAQRMYRKHKNRGRKKHPSYRKDRLMRTQSSSSTMMGLGSLSDLKTLHPIQQHSRCGHGGAVKVANGWSLEEVTARDDPFLTTARCVSPKTSTLMTAMNCAGLQEAAANNCDSIVVEASCEHGIKIALRISLRMKSNGTSSNHLLHNLVAERILVGGRVVYVKDQPLS